VGGERQEKQQANLVALPQHTLDIESSMPAVAGPTRTMIGYPGRKLVSTPLRTGSTECDAIDRLFSATHIGADVVICAIRRRLVMRKLAACKTPLLLKLLASRATPDMPSSPPRPTYG